MPNSSKLWDVFISHASEDKLAVALPLTSLLQSAGLDVWLDKQQLEPGDSLREKIDEGLALSSYGVVVLSPAFLNKQWPCRELNGLFALDEVQKCLIPLWHNISRSDILAYSPILADRLALNTNTGLTSVAEEIVRVVTKHNANSPAALRPNLTRRFLNLLESEPSKEKLIEFLNLNKVILHRALSEADYIMQGGEIAGIQFDFATSRLDKTPGLRVWHMLILGPADSPFVDNTVTIRPEVSSMVEAIRLMRFWVAQNLRVAREQFQDIRPLFPVTMSIGRRNQLTDLQRKAIGEFANQINGLSIRTCDWLLDCTIGL